MANKGFIRNHFEHGNRAASFHQTLIRSPFWRHDIDQIQCWKPQKPNPTFDLKRVKKVKQIKKKSKLKKTSGQGTLAHLSGSFHVTPQSFANQDSPIGDRILWFMPRFQLWKPMKKNFKLDSYSQCHFDISKLLNSGENASWARATCQAISITFQCL